MFIWLLSTVWYWARFGLQTSCGVKESSKLRFKLREENFPLLQMDEKKLSATVLYSVVQSNIQVKWKDSNKFVRLKPFRRDERWKIKPVLTSCQSCPVAQSSGWHLRRGSCHRHHCSQSIPGYRSPEESLQGQFTYLSVWVSHCFSLRVIHSNTWLTPSQGTELEDVGGHIGVKDLHKCKIHVDGLQSHPGEWCQQEVVQCACCRHTEAIETQGGQPGVHQKCQVQAQQRQREVY